MSNQIIQGETLAVLKTLPDACIQTCVTSPPYYGLRSYLPEGHPDKHLEIGLEETPEAYVEKLVQVFREVRRILRDDGTCWINLGDSYAGSWGNSGNRPEIDNKPAIQRERNTEVFSREGYTNHRQVPATAHPKKFGLKPKDLIGIPWMVAFALRSDGWYLRSDIIWAKSNCMPESVTDRPTKSHEYLFLLSKSSSYYYDAEAIKERSTHAGRVVKASGDKAKNVLSRGIGDAPNGAMRTSWGFTQHDTLVSSSRNRRSVWYVNTTPFAEAHFATFPPKLIEPCILAGSRPGDTVLDCFMGAGTVALVAIQHHRNYLGVELNPAYVKLAEKRIDTVQQNLWSGSEVVA